MPVIVTVEHVDAFTTMFQVEGFDLPEVVEEFVDVQLSAEIDAGTVFTAGRQDNIIVVNHDNEGLAKEWYVKVIDAVKDCAGDDHEVLSRLSNWP